MIAKKTKVKAFLKKLHRLLAVYQANIHGEVAFFDSDTDKWTDWMVLECNGQRTRVIEKEGEEEEEEISQMEKLEEIHADLLQLRTDLLNMHESILLLNKKESSTKKSKKQS